jgi:carbon monoxide dehydrogenase subunit G
VRLEHSFTVPADIDTVWQAVLDPERVAPCMPGATLSEVNGSAFSGAVKVKLGPISLLYKGSGEFLETDEQARRLVIKAAGKDSRGNGTAAATVTVTLTAEGESTTGSVSTDLTVTGKPAQFGRGMIYEVGGRILNTFATCLATKLAPEAQPQPESASEPERPPALSVVDPAGGTRTPEGTRGPAEPETEPLDLLSYAGRPAFKRAAPLVGLLVLVVVVMAIRRRSR